MANPEQDMIYCQRVEEQFTRAMKSLRKATAAAATESSKRSSSLSTASSNTTTTTRSSSAVWNVYLFPTIRECNGALAVLGSVDLLRALRLFGKMRQLSHMKNKLDNDMLEQIPLPIPTLVTYSTLMSRAVKASKPRVALRLWKLMLSSSSPSSSPWPSPSSSSFSSPTTITSNSDSNNNLLLRPDVRAANILMNCYAKLSMVEQAQDLLNQMKTGCGPDISGQPIQPNLVTYNSLLDACLKAGDLDAALLAKQWLLDDNLQPDARTYTSLIATVARQPSKSAGQNDPTPAFSLLQEMVDRGIEPNGMTYSALIDAAGRCRRSDLALQGLRMLLRQKNNSNNTTAAAGGGGESKAIIENEVGAWTAAIKACGTAGRLNTAIKLFYAMPNFSVQPNTVTCGCITDLLLKAGRTGETLEVLRYMKSNNIAPSEVMYTSLMTRAERLVQIEKKQYGYGIDSHDRHRQYHHVHQEESNTSSVVGDMKAIEVYTELMRSLAEDNSSRTTSGKPQSHQNLLQRSESTADSHATALLLQVFLVFQEMKAAGATPDLACYNALLRACARSGDVARANSVLHQIQAAGLDPNDTSWRQLLQSASKTRNSQAAISIWKQGLSYRKNRLKVDEPWRSWKPSVESYGVLLSSFLGEASREDSDDRKRTYYESCIHLYDDLLYGNEDMGMDRIDPNDVLENQRTMLLILQAIVALYEIQAVSAEKETISQADLYKMATSILKLDCFQQVEVNRLHYASARAYEKVKSWGAN